MPRPTVARIYPERLRHNLARVRAQAPASRVMACVKANGYGHGLLTVAKVLAPHCEGLGVATLEEALTLRAARVGGELLLMEGVHEPADWSTAAEHALSVAVTDPQQLEWLARQSLPRPLRCWLKIDTGMHRLGVAPAQVTAALAALRSHPQIDAQVTLMTHFARADERGSGSAEQQLQLFLDSSAGLDLARSSANSAAVLSLPDSHLDWVRPGYMLYGGSPFRDRDAAACDLLPAMNFESRIISLRRVETGEGVGYGGRWVAQRPSLIATVAAGYGDGYPRHAGDDTPVLIRGRHLPLAGAVSMDMLTVDVTDLADVEIGDPVRLWGDDLPVDEIAQRAGTIGYELLAAMPERVPRDVQH